MCEQEGNDEDQEEEVNDKLLTIVIKVNFMGKL